MPTCTKCNFEPPDPRARFCPSCGAMLEGPRDPSDPLIGRVVGDRYRVTSVIGQGGMGRVYLAEQKIGTTTRNVALKTLHPDLASDVATAQRFNREAETVIELEHSSTITFFDFGQTAEGTLYIVMEYIEGESLTKVMKRGPISVERVDRILSQVCGSLNEAHDAGIVHRDLKPDNIFLTTRAGEEDCVKVLDFGIAKRTELDTDSLKLTKAGFVLGTPPYMSPEQFAGQKLDRRSDVYSLGVLTYEMLTGKLPFSARTPWEWATQHMSADPSPMEATATGALLPESCRRAVGRALSKNPDGRPATVVQFYDEFSGRAPVQGLAAAGATAQATQLPPWSMEGEGEEDDGEHLAAWDEPVELPGRHRGATAVVVGLLVALALSGAAMGLIYFGVLPTGGARWLSWIPIQGAADAGGVHRHGFVDRDGSPPPVTDGAPPITTDSGQPVTPADAAPSATDAAATAPDAAVPVDPAVAAALGQLRATLRRGDLQGALRQLPVVEQLAGRRSDSARTARGLVRHAVSDKVGLALMRGDCARATSIYNAAKRVNAHRRSRTHFNPAWCPVPD